MRQNQRSRPNQPLTVDFVRIDLNTNTVSLLERACAVCKDLYKINIKPFIASASKYHLYANKQSTGVWPISNPKFKRL